MPALEPAVVAAIDDLELVARLIVEGLRSGQHRSPFHGFSTEFSQHRPYRAGDDFRHLDWKLLARTDRLYTRRFRETTNMSVMLVLDASASMAFPAAGGVSKFRYATMLVAALAYLVSTAGDRVGLMAGVGDRLTYLPAKGGRSHLRSILAAIERLEPAGTWQPPRVIGRAADLLKRRGLVIVLSDFYDDEDATRRELRRVARRGHDVAILQVVSRPEVGFDYRGHLEFEDLESGATRLVNAADALAPYRAAIEGFLARWRHLAVRDGVDYARVSTDEPPETALRRYLLQRGSPAHPHQSSAREER